MPDPALPGPDPAAAARRRWAIDVAITLVVTIAQLGASHGTSAMRPGAGPGWLSYLLLAAASVVLLGRRRYPVAVLAVSLAATLWAEAIGHVGIPWLALIVAFVNADLAGRRLAAIGSLVIGYAAASLVSP